MPIPVILLFMFLDITNERYFFDTIPASLPLISPVLFFISFWKIRQTRFYLVDFLSNGKIADLRYFDRFREENLIVELQDIEIELNNKTTRTGFDCELRIYIDNFTFTINNNFDWTFKEMKNLFVFIMEKNDEKLSTNDKFNLSRMV